MPCGASREKPCCMVVLQAVLFLDKYVKGTKPERLRPFALLYSLSVFSGS